MPDIDSQKSALISYAHKDKKFLGEYKGGYKSERNAPYSEIKEWEMGVEWQINKALELVTMYTITDRTNTTAISTANTRSYEQFEGGILRFQLQFNY